MQKFVAYLRVSDPKQGATGLGIEAQREAVSRYVQNRGQILVEYVEVETGKHANRPKLLMALADCREHRATLLIAKLDRLARNVAFIANLMNSDVEFVAVDMPTANRLTIHILAAVAEHERELISQRTKAALAAAKLRGIKLGNPRYLEALEKARAAIVYLRPSRAVQQLIAEWRNEDATLTEIADRLNHLSIPSAKGRRWHPGTVSVVLSRINERTKGRKNEGKISSASSSSLNDPQDLATPEMQNLTAGRGFYISGGPMPINIPEGERMIDVFASVGAREFVATKFDLNKNVKWGKTYSAKELRDKLPAMMRTAERREQIMTPAGDTILAGDNVVIRPRSSEVAFVQLDDLKAEQLDQVRPASFLMISTSPGNYQAWIAVTGVPEGKDQFRELMRRIRKVLGGNDKNASHATRVAGSENFKPQYSPEFPVVTITHAMPGRVMTEESLQQLGLIADPEPVKEWAASSARYISSPNRIWPDYDRALSGAKMNHSQTGPDISSVDFYYGRLCAQRGFQPPEIADALMDLSSKAHKEGRRYAERTATNAYDSVMKDRTSLRRA